LDVRREKVIGEEYDMYKIFKISFMNILANNMVVILTFDAERKKEFIKISVLAPT
jgi:hypothetical protein